MHSKRYFSSKLFALFATIVSINLASASAWDEPQDSAAAFLKPDQYAWQLFIALNWPADVVRKIADPKKKFGADGPVVWETWRNVRNGAPDSVFRLDGRDPGPWLDQSPIIARSAETDPLPLQQLALRSKRPPQIMFDRGAAIGQFNETRMNKETYEFVRANKLYNIEGQEELANAGIETISLPAMSKEIKAQWREITEQDKPRYHWTEDPLNSGKLYGLVALHITTKDIPNWLWATFEHIDNKKPEKQGGRPGNEGWLLKSLDRAACDKPPYDCESVPQGIGLSGTKWENYRLRGTQIDFIDSRGNPTLLANSKPEEGFQSTSSCITCHAMATIGKKKDNGANRLDFFKPDGTGFVGSPDPRWFLDDGTGGKYTQLDFIWSFFRARRAN